MVVEKKEEVEEENEVEEEEGSSREREGSLRQNRRELVRWRLSLVRRTALVAYDLRVTRFSACESAHEGEGGRQRERKKIADKEDERDGPRERLYHVRGSGGIAGSRVAAVVASLSSSTRNAAAGGADIGRKEGRANGLYARVTRPLVPDESGE